jgi:hypothetical protein
MLDKSLITFVKLFECSEKEILDLMKNLKIETQYDELLCIIG